MTGGFLEDGTLNPQFELNRPEAENPQFFLPGVILGVVRVESMLLGLWLITDFDVFITLFADIFYSNCFSNGILPIRLSEKDVEELFGLVERRQTVLRGSVN